MAQKEIDIKSAEAAGRIQFAINLLNTRLNHFIQAKIHGKEKFDFNKSVQTILQKIEIFFPEPEDRSVLRNKFRRAREIRNEYSHQNFDNNRFEHDVECLAKIAHLIKADDIENKILELITPEAEGDDSGWIQLKEEGNAHYKKSEWTEAMNCYTKAIRINPKVATLYSNRALCEIQLKKFQLAREDAEDALDLDPKNIKFYRILSEAVLNLSLYEEALNICKEGLEIDQRDEVLLLRHRDCQAIQITEEINRNPRAGGLDQLKALSQPGKFEKAMSKAMPKESDVDPEDVHLIKNKAEVMMPLEIAKAHRILVKSKGNPREEMKAFAIFENAAKRGSAEGLYNVSLMYKNGQAGLARDLLKSREYCLKAASQKPYVKFQDKILKNIGVAEAETSIAISYRDGLGVDQNDVMAFQWFLKSAHHGCPSGQNNLAMFLQNGIGCKQNLTSARAWFEQAADSDQAEAQFNLASMLIEGQGGPVDTARAAELLRAAADQGLPYALAALQKLMRSGATGVRAMSSSKKVVEEKAKKEDPEAIFLLGMNYLNGTGGFDEDCQKAEKYLRLASQLSHPEADLILGKFLLDLTKNEDAFHFIGRAAEIRGDPEAQWLLGTLYAYGQGCERDSGKGRKWLLRAKRQGYKGNDIESSGGAAKDDVNQIIELGENLEELESSKNLSGNGLKLVDRLERLMVGMVDEENLPMFKEMLNFRRKGSENPPTPNVSSIKEEVNEWIPEMLERAQKGSKTAQNFFESFKMIEEAEEFLNSNQVDKCFRRLRESYRVWDFPLIDVRTREAFFRAAKAVLDTDPKNAEALFVVLKYHARKKFDRTDQLSLARHCTALDPTVADFHRLLGCIYGFRQEFHESVRCLERALELDPQPEWLYELASGMRLLPEQDRNPSEIIAMYEKYLAANPPDSRKVPEAYYSIGFEYAIQKDMDKAKLYEQKGIEAESPNVRLPCFPPVEDNFPPKYGLKLFLSLPTNFEEKEIFAAKGSVGHSASKESTCQHCGKRDVSLQCSRCKQVKYCDRDCQKSHWKDHKKSCKQSSK